MKRPKFLFRVDENNNAKVYVGGKWHNHVTEILLTGKPQNITVSITEHKTNKHGAVYVADNEIVTEVKNYHFGMLS